MITGCIDIYYTCHELPYCPQERRQVVLARSERAGDREKVGEREAIEREKVDKLEQEFPALRKMEISPTKVNFYRIFYNP